VKRRHVGAERTGGVMGGEGFGMAAKVMEGIAAADPGFEQAWIEGDGAVEAGQPLLGLAEFHKGVAQIAVNEAMAWIGGDGPAQEGHGPGGVTRHGTEKAQEVQGREVPRMLRQHGAIDRLRRVQLALPVKGEGPCHGRLVPVSLDESGLRAWLRRVSGRLKQGDSPSAILAERIMRDEC
jgi:hypothetical protein